MNSYQMAWRSFVRKPVKSILLVLVVFIISLFLIAGMASENASIATQDSTRQAVGAGFLLEENAVSRSKRVARLSGQIGNKEGSLGGFYQEKIVINGSESWRTWTDNSFETLELDDIKKIASVQGISDYNIVTGTTAVNPVNFQRIEDNDTDQNGDAKGVSLIGNLDMSMYSDVLFGNLSLKTGRLVKSDDENVCVISEELAEKNNLAIGDRLQFNNFHDRENSPVSEAKIIGIYQVKEKMAPYMSGDTYRSENVIFTDLRFPEKAEGENSPLYAKAYFKAGNVDEYEKIKNDIKNVDIDWERYDLIDNSGKLDTMSSNFNNLQSMSQLLTWIAAGASFVILSLIFVFWLKSRVQEAGILLALGKSKLQIMRQILLEALAAAVVGIIISFAASHSVSGLTADYLVKQQVRQEKEQELLDEGKTAKPFVENEQEVIGVNVSVTPQILLSASLSVMALVILSVAASGIIILKQNPKDILSEMS